MTNIDTILDEIIDDTYRRIRNDDEHAVDEAASFYIKHHPELIIALIQQLVTKAEKDVVADRDLQFAYQIILEHTVAETRYALERGEEWAKSIHATIESYINKELPQSHNLKIWSIIFNSFYNEKFPISKNLRTLYAEQQKTVANEKKVMEMNPKNNFLKQMFSTMKNAKNPAAGFELANAFMAQLSMMPAGYKTDMVHELVELGLDVAKDIAILFLLSTDAEDRAHALHGIIGAFSNTLVTPTSMSRLLIIRDWLPKNEKVILESFIAEQRKKGATFAPLGTNNITKIVASEMDGVGVQVVIYKVRTKNKYRVCGSLAKYNTGVRDSWSTPRISERKADSILIAAQSSYEDLTLRKVNDKYAQKLFSHHINAGLQRGEVPDIRFLEMCEIINSPHWGATALNEQEEMLALETAIGKENLTDNFIKMSLQRSGEWYDTQEFTASWFEDDPKISQYRKQIKNRHELIVRICEEILEPLRDKWALHFLWMALWSKCDSKNDNLWKDFFVLAKCLYEKKSLIAIPFMEEMCMSSIVKCI